MMMNMLSIVDGVDGITSSFSSLSFYGTNENVIVLDHVVVDGSGRSSSNGGRRIWEMPVGNGHE